LRIKAKLKKIKSKDNLNLLFFEYYDTIIKVLMLEMNINLKIEDEAFLRVKPTLLYLSREKIDFENVMEVEIVKIENGEIMSKIICKYFEDTFEVLMLKENVDFDKKAFLYFKSNFVAVER
jgi:hypothetical protein